jgi:hypothetical protein
MQLELELKDNELLDLRSRLEESEQYLESVVKTTIDQQRATIHQLTTEH